MVLTRSSTRLKQIHEFIENIKAKINIRGVLNTCKQNVMYSVGPLIIISFV